MHKLDLESLYVIFGSGSGHNINPEKKSKESGFPSILWISFPRLVMLCMVPGGEEAEREGPGWDRELHVEEEELRGGGGPRLRLVLGR